MRLPYLTSLTILTMFLGTGATQASESVPTKFPPQVVEELAAAEKDTGWEFQGEDEGVKLWRKEVPGSDIVAFRGETFIPATLSQIAQIFRDTPRKLEWVSDAAEVKDVKIFSDFDRIEYNRTSTPWPLKDRDFVFRATVYLDQAGRQMYIDLKSVDDESMPERDCCVRATIHKSSYLLTASPDGKTTRVRVEIHADPKGSVPKWAVNMVQKSWPTKTLSGIARQTAKPDAGDHERLHAFFYGEPKNEAEVTPVSQSAPVRASSSPAKAEKAKLKE